MAWSKVLNFDDPLPYQAAIRAADLEIVPTSSGVFHAELTQISMDRLWMQRARESLPRVWAGKIHAGRAVIGFLTDVDQPAMQHCGMEVGPGQIVVNSANLMHRRTEAACHWGSMSLTPDDLADASRAIAGRELRVPSLTHVIQPSSAMMSRLLNLHEMVGKIAKTTPDILELPEVARALEQELILLMIRCLTENETSKVSAGTLRHGTIVARFEEFLEANPHRLIYLTEICAAIDVPERTLRDACEKHLGMGPVRYLNLRRMHLARRALLRADPSTETVTAIATDHGFWELGHFSVAYKALFGESPSASLHRPDDDRQIFLNRPSSLESFDLA